ncbi:MAG: hypothetical protein LBI03_01670 [Clostridiales bacterium]|jgi:hypothetical protein|nr:hypothetical protein [Clostridiales bacterium]
MGEIGFTMLITETVKIYKENFKKICLMAVLIFLPLSLVDEFVFSRFYKPDSQVMSDMLTIMSTQYILSLLGIIFTVFVVKLTFMTINSEQNGFDEIFNESFGLWRHAIITNLFFVLLIGCGLIFGIFPGIFFAFICAFYMQAIIAGKVSGMKAFRLSYLTVKSNMKYSVIFIIILLAVYLFYIFGIDFLEGYITLNNEILTAFVNLVIDIVNHILLSFLTVMMTLFYSKNVRHTDTSPAQVL